MTGALRDRSACRDASYWLGIPEQLRLGLIPPRLNLYLYLYHPLALAPAHGLAIRRRVHVHVHDEDKDNEQENPKNCSCGPENSALRLLLRITPTKKG